MRLDKRDKPTIEEFEEWYKDTFNRDLRGSGLEAWYSSQAADGVAAIVSSTFWKSLRRNLKRWDTDFKIRREEYPLFDSLKQLRDTLKAINKPKGYSSVLDKSYRWNVWENDRYPDPPEKGPCTAPAEISKRERDSEQCWFGPHNWFRDFPDIVRTRIVVNFFDGVGFLAGKMYELAERTTKETPRVKHHARHDGYHAAHLGTKHEIELLDHDSKERKVIPAQLEVQITTTIQVTINDMLHRVYEKWRSEEIPENWEWQHDHPAFSINYLGSTLHYLDGMIVTARSQLEGFDEH